MKLPLDRIRADGGTQTRASMSDEAVADYAEKMLGGEEFPPVVVFHDGDDWHIGDGFHRVEAARRAGLKSVEAEVRKGGMRDALLYGALKANREHAKTGVGFRLVDRRRCAAVLLLDSEWGKKSFREIGEAVGLSHNTVKAVAETDELVKLTSSPAKRVGKDGKSRPASKSKPPRAEKKTAAVVPLRAVDADEGSALIEQPDEFGDLDLADRTDRDLAIQRVARLAFRLASIWPKHIPRADLVTELRELASDIQNMEGANVGNGVS